MVRPAGRPDDERRAVADSLALDDYVAAVVANAPPLAPAQRARIAALLAPPETGGERRAA